MDIMKLKGNLGASVVEELDSLDETELKAAITQAAQAMKEVKEELDANEKYQQAKQACKDLSAGKRDLDKYQKGKTQYALSRLEDLGKMGIKERLDWQTQTAIQKARKTAEAAKKPQTEKEEENE
jgi:L-fucose isomerase-like protein